MIGLENQDTSFFYVSPQDDIKVKNNILVAKNNAIEQRVINLSITEEMGKHDSGSMSIIDDDNIFSHVFRSGAKINIVWGYKQNYKQNASQLAKRVINKNGSEDFEGGQNIRLLKGFVVSPSGTADNKGRIIYNLTFYGQTYTRQTVQKIWSGLTKYELVRQVMTDQLGIKNENAKITFDDEKATINDDFPVRQSDTPFGFLVKFAKRENAFFKVGQDSNGDLVGLFVSKAMLNNKAVVEFNKKITKAQKGNRVEFTYKTGQSAVNDMSTYNWSQNVGDSGTGDNVRLVYLNGRPTLFKSVAGTQAVQTYTFNPDKIKQILEKDKSLKNFWDLISIDNFEVLVNKGIFTPITQTTAPEGFGFKISGTVPIGNPLLTCPSQVFFRNGFPIPFTNDSNTFYLQKVTHSLSANGYSQSVEIADTFTITGGSFIGAVGGYS